MVRVQKLRKVFKKGTIDEKVAIDGITLHVKEGDFVTVIGSNGAGKTTLPQSHRRDLYDRRRRDLHRSHVRHPPPGTSEGEVSWKDLSEPLMGTASTMTIEENLAMADLRGKPRGLRWGVTKSRREFYKETLKGLDLGLETRLKDSVSLLSGGQRQSLTLLMATLSLPKLLLLDEHTAALDPKTAQRVIELTEKIVRENHLTTIMVTHNMQQAIRYGNRMIMLHEGKVKFDIQGDEKRALTVEEVVKRFGADLKDEALLCA